MRDLDATLAALSALLADPGTDAVEAELTTLLAPVTPEAPALVRAWPLVKAETMFSIAALQPAAHTAVVKASAAAEAAAAERAEAARVAAEDGKHRSQREKSRMRLQIANQTRVIAKQRVEAEVAERRLQLQRAVQRASEQSSVDSSPRTAARAAGFGAIVGAAALARRGRSRFAGTKAAAVAAAASPTIPRVTVTTDWISASPPESGASDAGANAGGAEPRPLIVCFAFPQAEFAAQLATLLTVEGYDVWMDEADDELPATWDEAAAERIALSTALVVIMSPATVHSRSCDARVDFARTMAVPIVPMLYADCWSALRRSHAWPGHQALAHLSWIDCETDVLPSAFRNLRSTLDALEEDPTRWL